MILGSMCLTGLGGEYFDDVVSVTKRERQLIRHMPPNLYVIESIISGKLLALQDSSGAVYAYFNNRFSNKIYDSIGDYIAQHK
jgi:hypothetical protein